MNNTDLELHESECEDQPKDFPCICEQIKVRRNEEIGEQQMEMERGN